MYNRNIKYGRIRIKFRTLDPRQIPEVTTKFSLKYFYSEVINMEILMTKYIISNMTLYCN